MRMLRPRRSRDLCNNIIEHAALHRYSTSNTALRVNRHNLAHAVTVHFALRRLCTYPTSQAHERKLWVSSRAPTNDRAAAMTSFTSRALGCSLV